MELGFFLLLPWTENLLVPNQGPKDGGEELKKERHGFFYMKENLTSKARVEIKLHDLKLKTKILQRKSTAAEHNSKYHEPLAIITVQMYLMREEHRIKEKHAYHEGEKKSSFE